MAETRKNDESMIKTTVEAPESWQRVVKAEVARTFFDKEYADRLKKAAKSHSKPGFRKGKTPRAMVEKDLGEMIRMETIEDLVPKAWMSALLEHKLSPITDPALENFEFPEDGPLTFDLVVEVRPEVEVNDYENLPIKKREAVVADEDVDQVIERLRESRVVYERTDRTAEDGDQVTLDLLPLAHDGQPDEGKLIADQKLILGSGNNLPAFEEALTGAAAEETRNVTVTYPSEHPNEGLRGQEVTFECRIKEVAAKVLPEVDDSFAAQVGDGKTLLELRTDIRKELLAEAERRIAQELDRQLLTHLTSRNPVELPPSMVEKYLDSSMEELHRRNLQIGRENTPDEDQEYREAGRAHAELALKGMLLLEAVRGKEDIKVTPEDVDERIEEIAATGGFDVDKYREYLNSGDEKDRIEYDLLERRTYDFLLSRAEIEEVSADTDVFAEEEK